jgi:hypothetical protein
VSLTARTPSSVEVKNDWSYTTSNTYLVMALCRIKSNGNFILAVNGYNIVPKCVAYNTGLLV